MRAGTGGGNGVDTEYFSARQRSFPSVARCTIGNAMQVSRYLGDSHRRADGVWVCNLCGRDESYALAESLNPDLVTLVEHAVDTARNFFGLLDDGYETRLFLGDRPETVWERSQRAFHIYLARDSNWNQFSFSGAHEAY